jgi:hypothetical protein
MFAYPLRTAALAAAAIIGLSGCAYNGLYSGVGVGVGNGYYDPYYGSGYGYGAGYSDYGYGYGVDPYWGWYDGYYYPGTGYYVYDRDRRPHRWTDRHRRHWEGRRDRAMSSSEFRRAMEAHRVQQDQQNWSGFNQGSTQVQRVRRGDSGSTRVNRSTRTQRVERSDRSTERSTSRGGKGSNRQSSAEFRRSQEAKRAEER